MKLRHKVFSAVLAIAMLGTSITAFAEDQTVCPTHDGYSVNCTLSVSWALFYNDNATAITSWSSSRSGHTLGVRLYYKDNSSDSWHFVDGAMNSAKASVSGSRAGVYEYLSEHYVYHTGTNGAVTSTYNLTSLTDW